MSLASLVRTQRPPRFPRQDAKSRALFKGDANRVHNGVNAYSPDLRLKIVQAVDRGLLPPDVAHTFGVHLATVYRYLQRRRATGSVARTPIAGAAPRIPREQDAALLAQLQAHPDATLDEHCRLWAEATGQQVSVSTMCRLQQRLGLTRKKSPSAPANVTRSSVPPSGS